MALVKTDEQNYINIANAIREKTGSAETFTPGEMDDAILAIPTGGGSGLTNEVKQALLQIAEKVAYIDDQGQTYYQALHDALYVVTSISAVFTQGNRTIFSNADIDSLKELLVVTATYDDESTAVVTDYTLSGTLTAGISTITVTYGDKTDSFSVIIAAFTIPDGYTRYGYITKKNQTQTSKVALSNFIFLNAYQDMSVLSLEAYIGKNSNPEDSAGWFGARNNTSGNVSCSLYYGDTNGLTPVWRGIDTDSPTGYVFPSASAPVKLEIINPVTSPFYVKVNGETVAQGSWETSPVISSKFILFNNVWDTATTNFAINKNAEIGDLIFRKADGECVGYYIPTVYDGKIGMYDVVSETFYTAANANAVTISNSGCYYSVGNW